MVPFHQGFNETAALTSRIVDFGIYNSFTTTPLLFADFDNLLGVSNVAAAQFFGDDIGRVGDGGLTPGLIGGVLLDFKETFFVFFLILGLLLLVLRTLAQKSRIFLGFYVLLIVQLMHLFHRGFVKPEYITIMMIASIYFMTFKRVSRNENL